MSASELKPCPWCSAEMLMGSEEPFFAPDRFMFYVFHSSPIPEACPFSAHGRLVTRFYDSAEEAVRVWNAGATLAKATR